MTVTVLAVDIGTSSTKGVLCDTAGAVLATAERANHTSTPRAGHFEQDADTTWWNGFREMADALLREHPEPPGAVCVTGLGPCLLPADRTGRPLRPAILYGVDTRAERQIRAQRERYGADAVLARCGSPLTSQAIGPKLQWLRETEPGVWARTRRFFMANSYVGYRLTGKYYLDHHSASQAIPLYDLAGARWTPDWAPEIAGDVELPPLAWPGDVVGTVTASAARDTGLRAGTPVLAGTVDAWAEALSVGVSRPGDRMLMYGTSMFVIAVDTAPLPDARLWTTNGIDPGTRTVAAGMSTFGAATRWFRRVFGDVPFETLEEEAREVPPGADGLVVLPYFAGERTPIFDPDARGVIAGLTLSHSRGHLYRALLEGTAMGVRHNFAAMADAGLAPNRTVAIGGGSRRPLWRQIVSDVTGVPQELPAVQIGAAYGGAMLAASCSVPDDWTRITGTVEPDPNKAAVYDRLYDLYLSLYDDSADIVHRLARPA